MVYASANLQLPFRNSVGFSLIGKCPRPFMMVTSHPWMLLATPSVSSGVQE